MTRPLSTLIVGALCALLLTLSACTDEDACSECAEEKCSDLISVCDQDADCACMADCLGVETVAGVDRCFDQCGVTERPPGFAEVEECVAIACPDSGDECATPASWVSPVEQVTGGPIGDIGGGDLADCAFDSSLAFDGEGSVLQLADPTGEVCVRLERRNEGAGSLANTQWSVISIDVGKLGQVAHVEEGDAACYYSSHHNFRDVVHVWTGTRHHGLMLMEDGHGGPRTYFLHTFEGGPLEAGTCNATTDGTDPIGNAIELFPVEAE